MRQIEGKAAAQDVFTQKPQLPRLLHGQAQMLDGHRVFGPHVEVALLGAQGVGPDYHAFQDRVGIALHDHAVHERAGVALVAVCRPHRPDGPSFRWP